MNPILRETLNKIKKHIDLTEGEEMFLMREIGNCMSKVAYGCSTNPNFNLCGGEYADENSYVPDGYLYSNIFNNESDWRIGKYYISKRFEVIQYHGCGNEQDALLDIGINFDDAFSRLESRVKSFNFKFIEKRIINEITYYYYK